MAGLTSRERVMQVIEHRATERRVPFTISLHESLAKYGEPLLRLVQATGCDFYDTKTVKLPDVAKLQRTSMEDQWGCRWDCTMLGKTGVVSYSPLEDWSNFPSYKMPAVPKVTAEQIEAMKKFGEQYPIWASVEHVFQIMQNIRGTENIMTDFYTQPDEVRKLMHRMLTEYHLPAIEEQLKLRPDVVQMGDDWGTQTALLINPAVWREFMKPFYRQMVDLIHQGGAKAWFHSCGYTREILPEMIDLGMDVINPQVSCMDIAEYGAVARGKITIVPDADRQHVMLNGTPDLVRRHILDMYGKLGNARGGLIGYVPIEPEMPFENIKALLEVVSTYERS